MKKNVYSLAGESNPQLMFFWNYFFVCNSKSIERDEPLLKYKEKYDFKIVLKILIYIQMNNILLRNPDTNNQKQMFQYRKKKFDWVIKQRTILCCVSKYKFKSWSSDQTVENDGA